VVAALLLVVAWVSVLWFDLPAHMMFHVANAWEEQDGTVKVWRRI
jgi:carotenoid cleavage dioxygenase-like enzyme